jgi:glycine C-acetyltransferase
VLFRSAAHAALDSHGFGLSSVRFICGTQDIHKRLEAAIAAFHGTEDAILFPSCFDANAGTFEALLGKDDAVISDELNHASIIDGIRLCKAERRRYKHCDMADLEAQLVASAGARVRMIVTDGVFSMDGDVAPLAAICDLADKHKALVFIDECHATGFFGATGRGTDEYAGVRGRVDIINSTLGKALGGATGGYTAGSRAVVDVLRQRARPYLFSNSVAPAVVGASLEVFKMIAEDSSYVERVRGLTHRFRGKLTAAGFTLRGAMDHPIVPVMLGDARLAAEFAEAVLARGVYVVGFSFPVVPKGAARIRTQISAAHTEADVDAAADAFIAVGREKGVIPAA